jgi:acyl-CoA synthetase (NDP forming)
MIIDKLINPGSIVVVGGSDDLLKPGGKILKNIIEGKFAGHICVVNPKQDIVQGVKSYRDLKDIPETDLAILAIQAKFCLPVVEMLVREKNTKAFIIISAGFSEAGEEGKKLEKEIVEIIPTVSG